MVGSNHEVFGMDTFFRLWLYFVAAVLWWAVFFLPPTGARTGQDVVRCCHTASAVSCTQEKKGP